MTCLEKFREPAYGFLQSVSTGLIVVSIISMCFQDVEPVLTRNMTIVPFWKLAASNAVRPIDTRGPVEAPKRPDSNKGWMDGQPVPTQKLPTPLNTTKTLNKNFALFQLQKRRRNNRKNNKLQHKNKAC